MWLVAYAAKMGLIYYLIIDYTMKNCVGFTDTSHRVLIKALSIDERVIE